MSLLDDLMRHVHACQTAVLPGGRLPLRIGGIQAGWVRPDTADALRQAGAGAEAGAGAGAVDADGGVTLARDRVQPAALALSQAGWFRWRDEGFDVRADTSLRWDGPAAGPAAGPVADPVLATVDRGALPLLGIAAWGAHLNGLVQRPDGWHIWVAKRAADRPMDPGKLDHIAAGGVPAGLTPTETLTKEAAEEAGIPAALSAQARAVGRISYAMEREEGLRRDRIACFDLVLPAHFQPEPHDKEIESFALWPVAAVLDRVRRTDDFKFNVNLVLIDLFVRLGSIRGDDAARLRTALDAH